MATIEKRTGTDGEPNFRVKVRLRGYPSQSASFSRLTDARKWAQDTESSIRNGRHFKTAEAKKHTLTETIKRYEDEVLKHKKGRSTDNVKHYLKWWDNALGEYTLADVSSALVVEHRNKLLGTVNKFGRQISSSTANRYVTALGHVFTVANNEWEWTENNPVRKVSKYKEPRGRIRFLSDEERGRLLDVTQKSGNPYLYAVIVLALSTGGRKMEILGLKWADVDFKRKVLTLHETKNGERRLLPLQGRALELMQERFKNRDEACEYVFPAEGKCQPIDIRTAWENALIKAEVLDFRFHDLRHSAASYLAMNGASLSEIAEVLGHKTLQMVKRYAHLSEAHTSKVVASMNEKIFGNV